MPVALHQLVAHWRLPAIGEKIASFLEAGGDVRLCPGLPPHVLAADEEAKRLEEKRRELARLEAEVEGPRRRLEALKAQLAEAPNA